jgi:hypothetical protein
MAILALLASGAGLHSSGMPWLETVTFQGQTRPV